MNGREVSLKGVAGGAGRMSLGGAGPRTFLSPERMKQSDWIHMAGEVGRVIHESVMAGAASGAAPGQVPHEVIIRYATAIGPVLADIYNAGYVDGQGSRQVGIIEKG